MINIEALNARLATIPSSRRNDIYWDIMRCIDEIESLRATFGASSRPNSWPTRTVKYRFFDYKRSLELGRKRTFAGELIKRRSDLTHSEFQFSPFFHDISFSSTIEDAFKGCRFKMIYYTHAWWRTIERQVSAEQELAIWFKAHSINGKKYDLWGLGSHATPWRIIVPSRDRYWCSENNTFITKPAIYTGKRTEITPDELYAWLKNHPQTA